MPEETDDLPELFLEADDVSFTEDDLKDSEEDEEQEARDEDEVGSIVSDDDEDSIGLSGNDQTIKYDPTSTVPIFCIDMGFENVTQVRQAISKYAIVKGVGLRYYSNDKDRIRVHCLVGCPWKLYVSMERNNNTMMVKTYTPNHKCYRVQNNPIATSNNLAFLLKKKIAQQPGIRVKGIKDFCKSEYKLNVGWSICQRVRKKVLKDIVGDYIEQYGDLHDYSHEILRTNPGSTCVVETSREESTIGEFLRLYVCFKACKEGFINGCRKLIGVDGCFLKGLCEGQLLCAIGRDGNNQMFPIAWAVVRIENAYNWGRFLRLLKYDLPLGDGEGYIIMSDMQKGLDKALREELPAVYHRMCARHIYAAWAKRWRGAERKKYFWKCAKSSNENQLQRNMDKLATMGKDIVQDMIEYPIHQWVRAFFPEMTKCDMVDNNISETFNGWILYARYLPIITMLDEIRRMVMTRITRRREFSKTWICDISPMAMKRVERNKSKSFDWQMVFNGEDGYEILSVKNIQVRHVVSLLRQTCTCREWQLSGIPCRHAICAIYAAHKHPEQFVLNWYHKYTFLKAYNYFMYPMQGKEGWQKMNKGLILPPPYKAKVGRPKLNRRKDNDEPKKVGKASRVGRKMTCSLCKQQGHNKTSCPTRPRGVQTINVRRSSWMLQGDRAVSMSMQNVNAFLQRQQDGCQTNTQASSTQNPTPTLSSSIASGSRSILGHKYKGLQWNGFDAVTGRQLQEIRDKKRTRKD